MSSSIASAHFVLESDKASTFDEFVRKRGRMGRSGSLALPHDSLLDSYDQSQQCCISIALLEPSPTIRRHSAHSCPVTEARDRKQEINVTSIIPPPVPKRTFQGKLHIKPHSKNTQETKHVDELAKYDRNFDTERERSLDVNVFEERTHNGSRHSQFSSCDSTRSQSTLEADYTSSENEKLCQVHTLNYRSRISSVDTQSSLDSCFTEKTADSKDSVKNNRRLCSQTDACQGSNLNEKMAKSLPAVPIRRHVSVPSPCDTFKSKPIPPTPPVRTQHSLESVKLQLCNINNETHRVQHQQQHNVQAQQLMAGKRGFQKMQENQNSTISKATTIHTKLRRANKPPPIANPKFHQRQDSSLSSDSYSLTSSPGYNCKSMEAPLIQHASKINKSLIGQESSDSFVMTPRNNTQSKTNCRQDSTISSDSFSQTSSPGYNTKIMEAPLLPHSIKMCNSNQGYKVPDVILKEPEKTAPTSPITKSSSTPVSLQTIVRFQSGSRVSLQHRILNRRKSSNPYVTQGRLKFRLFQILLNAIALLAIAGGLAAYFNAYTAVKFINKTVITSPQPVYGTDEATFETGKNPAPGVCLPVIVKFCQSHKLPYNFTVFPNYIGNFGQPEAQTELEAYDALVDVKCYELVSLFLCALFVPKCGPTGTTVPPCKTLCVETMRRCGFFFDVFGLELPEYLTCNLFADVNDSDECVGLQQVREVRIQQLKPVCSGFLCDQKRCIPSDWRCDGHVDCLDQSDESLCDSCGKGSIYCGEKRCMSQKHVCDGVMDCPWGQDERNCVRLSERNGDLGKGTLEVYKADVKLWAPACVMHWDSSTSPTAICSMLGYSSVNSSKLSIRGSNMTMSTINKDSPAMWRMLQKKHSNLLNEFSSCPVNGQYSVVELTCTNFECGKIRNRRLKSKARIVGGVESAPGDWPFLAAILGGPEEIFYCAGVLIADQWVLTASHCIGNHTLRNINDWTIQLGITRRHSHTYYGQKVKVRKVIPHPLYNSFVAHDNDIALFQLSTRVAFHEHLLPVCLPPSYLKELKPGTLCTVIGWGKREDKNSNPNSSNASYEPTVNEVQVPVLNRDLCNEWLETLNVTDGMICAGYQEGGKDACQGDSGGPLLCRDPADKERWFVGGIVSWGIMCAHPKLPGVYANVPKYIPWITQQINKYSKTNYDTVSGY